jgi:O-antigen ligase
LFFYNFGLEGTVGYILYGLMWVVLLITIFKRPVVGIYYITLLIPLQTLRYRLNAFPLGSQVVGLILLGVVIGLWRRKRSAIPKTPWTIFLILYAIFLFISLIMGSFYLGRPFPIELGDPRFQTWRDYITMFALLFLVAAAAETKAQLRMIVLIMCFSGFLLNKSFWGEVSGRDFYSYSEDLRDEGGMGYAGVNGLAAFEAQFSCLLLMLGATEKQKLLSLMYYGLAVFAAFCLMYSLSRGGYAAFLLGWLFIGIVKNRKLLLLLLLFGMTWTTVVPNAVRERIFMTDEGGDLDHSSETRVSLWEDAIAIYQTSPILGTGFNTYAYMQHIANYKDTHNIYLKVLVETGAVGLLLFLLLLFKFFKSGIQLAWRTNDPFFASLGYGLAGWIVAAMGANVFGDRWTFLQVNGYMWILGGLLARALIITNEPAPTTNEDAPAFSVDVYGGSFLPDTARFA